MSAAAPVLTYDANKHEYKRDGVIVPSVTQILKDCGIIDDSWYTPDGTLRGAYAHDATALDDRGVLDEAALDDTLRPYLVAWRLFRQQSDFEIVEIERRVWADSWLYAGTYDRLGMWDARSFLLDIKTGDAAPWHALQTAAYADCVGSRPKRACVYLRKTGGYTVDPHTSLNDIGVFRAATAIWHWKRNNRP